YYGVVFVIQFLVNGYVKDFYHATSAFLTSFQSSVIILGSVVVRLSRFTLIQGRWQPIKLELPFGYSQGSGVSIKGGSIYGTTLNKYYEEYFTINPLSKNASIDTPRVAYIEKRLFLEGDEIYNVAKVFRDDKRELFDRYLLRSKTKDTIFYNDKYPIAALLRYKDTSTMEESTLKASDFGFVEWVYAKPLE
ncbi:MAG TPA: hypothetical protein VNZ45_02940, partial [Bacteroidia bacterium]|nr:hypothetical protein [Bacteroidia bacterium]